MSRQQIERLEAVAGAAAAFLEAHEQAYPERTSASMHEQETLEALRRALIGYYQSWQVRELEEAVR